MISIHAPRVGRDFTAAAFYRDKPYFNPRAPCGARPGGTGIGCTEEGFQSTRPVWGATRDHASRRGTVCISIHAPRVGRDCAHAFLVQQSRISIHAPRVGRDTRPRWTRLAPPSFQSTRPVWGATVDGTLRAFANQFQSTRPVWGATFLACPGIGVVVISIHAPRVGRDCLGWYSYRSDRNFNPRAPCGARQSTAWWHVSVRLFQSTRPVWGATGGTGIGCTEEGFQSTRPVWGATRSSSSTIASPSVFQSTRPVWGATESGRCACTSCTISIHAPRVGRDSKFDDFTPSNLHKRYKRVLARPKSTREKGKIKQKLAYIHAFSAFLGCEGSGTFCALVLRTQYR